MTVDIITIGEAMLELSCEGDPRLARTFNQAYGGDTLNTAVAAQRLGSRAAFVTKIGQDPFAYGLKETLNRENLDASVVRVGQGQTGLYITSVSNDEDGRRQFYYYRQNSAASYLAPEDLPLEMIRKAKVVFSSGITLALSESARRTVYRAFELARKNNVITAFDPNYRPSLWRTNEKSKSHEKALDALSEILPLVDVMLPSIPHDTQTLIGFSRPEQVVDYFLYKGVKVVAVKAGAQGCFIGYKKQIEHIAPIKVKVVDTTGAGDAFNGGFLHGLVNGRSLIECAQLAVVTSGLKVMNRGTINAMPYRDSVYGRL